MTRRLLAVLLLATAAGATGAVAAPPPPAAAAPTTRYVFTAFTNSSESNMYVYTSADARTFTLLKGPAYTPPGTLVRDPSIMKHTDGRYYVVYTTNWEDNKFGIASSADLVNWSFHQHVNVPVAGVRNTWAPEWFTDSDGSVNVIVSISTNGSNFRPYRFRATNSALTAWAAPVALTGFASNHIDTFIVKSGSTYHAFTKQETTKYVEHATAPSLNGPYTFVGTGNWSGWGNFLEGQAVVRLDNGSWRIFMDGYTVGQYYYADSTDLNTWTAKQIVPGGLSGFIRHGTVLRDGPVDVSTFTSTAVVQHSGQCLDVPNGTATGGTQLRQWGCNGTSAQSFQFRPVAGTTDTYTVVNTGNGLCLDVNGVSTANGAAVIQWSCNGGANQQFTLRPFTGLGNARDFQLVARHSNRCVDISDAATSAGALAIQWDCGTGRNQIWRLSGKP
jgi:hypothetical protein